MISRRLFLLAISLLAIGWTRPPQATDGAVVGQVTNGTPGGDVPANLEITLYIFAETGAMSTDIASVAADGSFRFDGLATDAGDTFVASAVYQDVTYFSEESAFESGQTELALPIAIYETTEDPSAIFITQAHLFLTVAGDRLQVGEYYLVSNSGDRTVIGAPDPETGLRTTLSVILPAGASSLSLDGGADRFVQQAAGFADTSPIPPGVASSDVSFSYELAYSQGQRVERVFAAPVDSVVLVPMTDGWTLAGAGLQLVEAQGAEWPPLSYTAGPLAAGEVLAFSLVAGSPSQATPAAPRTRSASQEAAIGLAALAAALAAAYFLWRPAAPGPIPERARPLVEAIAALDADVERIPEKTYRQKRNDLKKQLRATLKDDSGARDS